MKFTSTIFTLLFVLFLSISYGQNFKVNCPKNVSVNQIFDIGYVIENMQGSNPTFPKFTGFEVESGPSISNSTSIINGSKTSSQGYYFSLVASSPGDYVIGSASIMVDGKVIKSAPCSIHVSNAASSNQNEPSGDIKVIGVASASKNKMYVGEQIRLDYKLYYGEQIGIANSPTLPPYDDFFTKNLNIEQQTVPNIQVKNSTYQGALLGSIALYPRVKGIRNLASAKIKVQKEVQGDPFSNPFGSYINKSINTNVLTLDIKPLPTDNNENFSGLVGDYTMKAGLNSNTSSTSGSLVLRMKIRGNGDEKQMAIPKLFFGDSVEVFQHKIVGVTEEMIDGVIYHTTEIDFPLKFKYEGTYSFAPKFKYFDVKKEEYIELTKELIGIQISKGQQVSKSKFYTEDEDTSSKGNSGLLVLLASIFVAGALLLWGRRAKKSKMADAEINHLAEPSKEELFNNAAKFSREKLLKAYGFLNNGNSDDFFKEVELALNGYIKDKYQVMNEDLTKEKIYDLLLENHEESSFATDYIAILSKIDLARYGKFSGNDLTGIYEKSSSFITNFELS
jgi:hypothetical protein